MTKWLCDVWLEAIFQVFGPPHKSLGDVQDLDFTLCDTVVHKKFQKFSACLYLVTQ